jgi:hypothetical protein
MTDTALKRARGTRRRRIFIILISTILLILVMRAGVDFWARRQVDAEVSRLQQRYGGLEVPAWDARPVAAGENRARAFRAAAALLAGQHEMNRSVSAFLSVRAPNRVPQDLRAFVEANRPALRVADDARGRRAANWEADYAGGTSSLPWLDLRMLSGAISVAARMDLDDGRPDEAAQKIASGLALSASVRQEPNLIAQLIRVALGIQQFESVQRLISQSEPSTASLEDLARWLAENRTPGPMDVGLLSELRYFNAVFARAERTGPLAAPDEQFAFFGRFTWFARPLIRVLHARYLEQVGDLLDVQTGPRPRPVAAAPAHLSFSKRLDGIIGVAGLRRTMDTDDLFKSGLGATELAVALRRFRLDHGTYPDDLSMLVPGYLANIPIDAFTGKPPVYVRQGAGFRLHAENAKNFDPRISAALAWTVPN